MQNLQNITRIFDIAIPLMLYFIWDWDLHFILLFAYLDTLTGIVVSAVKERKIERTRRIATSKFKQRFLTYALFGILGIIFFELAIVQLYPEIQLWESFIDFLLFKELGIPQIVWIVPLVILLNYQQYQIQFIKSRVFELMPLNYLANNHRNTWLFFAISGLFVFGLSTLVKGTPLLFLFVIVGFKALVDFILIPLLDKQFVQQFVNSPHDFKR